MTTHLSFLIDRLRPVNLVVTMQSWQSTTGAICQHLVKRFKKVLCYDVLVL